MVGSSNYKKPITTLLTDSLFNKIKEVIGSIDRDTMLKACKCFQSRLKAVVEADSNFIN